MLVIYNDYKKQDWLDYKGGLPVGTVIILNNEVYSSAVVSHLRDLGLTPIYSYKLCDDVPLGEGLYSGLDAENYRKDIVYTFELGYAFRNKISVLYPENLGGEKYRRYEDFIRGVSPKKLLMERTYKVWKPWELKMFWDRHAFFRKAGIEVFMGIWPESLPQPFRWLQYFFAKIISGGNIFWYSETKSLPEY